MTRSPLRTRSLFIMSGALLLASATLSACGARQGGDACPSVKEGLSPGAWESWATCVEAGQVQGADTCRTAMTYAQGMTPAALAAGTRCVLAADSAEDGGLVGDVLQRIAGDEERVAGLARGLAPNYRHDTHGARFASSLGQAAERALAAQLGAIPEGTRDEIIRTAFAWGLRELSDAGLPFIRDTEAWSEELEGMAARAANARTLSVADQLSLVATGRWGANEVLDCLAGTGRGCEATDVNQAAQLLQHDTRASRNAIGTSRVVDTLANDELSTQSVSILLDWVSAPTTPNGEALLRSLRTSIAATGTSEAYRMRVAEGANAQLCASRSFPQVAIYAMSSSPTPTAPWRVFIDRCTDLWGAEDLARVLSVGVDSHISDAQRALLRQKLSTELAGGTCEQVAALGQTVIDTPTAHDAKRGIVWAELSRARTDCSAALQAPLRATADSTDAHPEARLRAIEALATSGDRQRCSAIDRAQQWNAERTGVPVGNGVIPARDAARAACR